MRTDNTWPAYRWSLKYLLSFKKLLLLIVVSNLVITGTDLVLPKVMQLLIDSIHDNTATVRLLVCVVFVVAISLFLKTFIRGRLNVWNTELSEHSMKQLHQDMFTQLRGLGIAFVENKSAGEILSLYHQEVRATQSLFTRYFPKTIEHVIFLILGFLYLLSMHWLLALAIIPFFLSYYLIGPSFERKAALLSKEQAEKNGELHRKIYDSISSLIETKYLNASEWDNGRLNAKQESLIRTSFRQFFNAYMRGTVRRLSVAFGSVFIFLLGAWYVRNGQITVGEFVALSILYFTVIERLTYLVTNLTEQKIISQQIVRLHNFMQEQPAVREVEQPVNLDKVRGDFVVDRVSFAYQNQTGRLVVDQLSFRIRGGEKVALVGTSGSGKSTILKLLGRLYDPDEGAIYLDGVNIRSIAFASIRNAIGYVFQESYLFPGSIRDNIRFGRLAATDAEVEEAARAAHAMEFIRELPEGFDTALGERGFKLSGGQKQRIAIARLFLKNPPVLFLDEATSALDNVSEREVQKALLNLMRGRTTVTVAHRLSTVLSADRIYVIRDGSIAEEGTYLQLMERGDIFYGLVRHGGLSLSEEATERGGA
ncbi:ABC transporter ATP-binding protein [Paenibacillus glucanolyticus]|uniref:ABC transporter ATP-binding protein n=1 Tax=Paenibacillus glucanolyticus TaxID=59843 RepID=UPI00368DEDA6